MLHQKLPIDIPIEQEIPKSMTREDALNMINSHNKVVHVPLNDKHYYYLYASGRNSVDTLSYVIRWDELRDTFHIIS